MRVLLDTCVLSELYKSSPLETVKAEVNNIKDEDLYLGVITIGEIKKGITLLPDSRRQRDLKSPEPVESRRWHWEHPSFFRKPKSSH